MNDTAITLTVNKEGILDLLAKTGQTLHIAAMFLKQTGNVVDSIAAEVCSSYLEALAAGLEHNLEEQVIRQLMPLTIALAKATGEEGVEENTEVLKGQIEEMVQMVKEARETKEPYLILVPESETLH
jgi:hypothetical protein